MSYASRQRAVRYKRRSSKTRLRWRLILSVSLLIFGLLLNSSIGVYVMYGHSQVGVQRMAVRSAVNGLLHAMTDQMAGVAAYVTTNDMAFLASYREGEDEYTASLNVLQADVQKPEFESAILSVSHVRDRATDWMTAYAQPQITNMQNGRTLVAHSRKFISLENKLFTAFQKAVFAMQITFDSIFSNICASFNIFGISVVAGTLILSLCVIFWLWHAFTVFSTLQEETLSHLEHVLTLFSTGDMTARMPTGADSDLNEVAISFNKMASSIYGMQTYIHVRYRAEIMQHIHQQAEVNRLLRQKQDELSMLRLDLNEAISIRSCFLSMMSHELRTPLAAIIGFGQMIQRSSVKFPLNMKQQSNIDRMLKNAQHLLGIIDDLLDLAQIETGGMDLRIFPVDIHKLVMEVCSEVHSLPTNSGITLDSTIDNDVLIVKTDPQKLRRILLNLISNAFKFTEQGRVSLHVSRRVVDDALAKEMEQVSISISDTGIGIPLEKQKHIFEAFYQVDNTCSRQYGGTGLGLTIAQKLTLLLGGFVECQSLPGEGSTFTVVLPVSLEDQCEQHGACVHICADRSVSDTFPPAQDQTGADSASFQSKTEFNALSSTDSCIPNEVGNSTLVIG